jgi:hypothetical protein
VPSTGSDPDEGAAEAAPQVLVEVRPPPTPAQCMAFIAVGSAVLAVLGIATGQVLLGLVALVSAGWLLSLAYVSLTGWARVDERGIAVRWVRSIRAIAWSEMAAVEVDRSGPGGSLRATEVVRTDGAAARWAPWYPFLPYAHASVARSIEELSAEARRRGVEVKVHTSGPAPTSP